MQSNRNFTDNYVDIYHMLNPDKSYFSEIRFVLNKFAEHSGKEFPKSVLDLGCGLGDHLKFIPEQVQKCVGVDSSPTMIMKAEKQKKSDKFTFVLSDIGDYKSKFKFELVFSLFHVLSYQTKLESLESYFRTISATLEPAGVALADFWHRPAWDKDPPIVRTTKRETQTGKVTRVSRPNIDFVNGLVDIDMQVEILKPGGEILEISESHEMRAFTVLEIELLAKMNGLSILEIGDWSGLHGEPIKSSTWYGYVVMKKEGY